MCKGLLKLNLKNTIQNGLKTTDEFLHYSVTAGSVFDPVKLYKDLFSLSS